MCVSVDEQFSFATAILSIVLCAVALHFIIAIVSKQQQERKKKSQVLNSSCARPLSFALERADENFKGKGNRITKNQTNNDTKYERNANGVRDKMR